MNVHDQRAPVDATLLRRVMSRFATGVTVITAEAEGGVHGMTANAFMSGSLTPPLCIISIAVNARMHKYLHAAGHFGVNILAKGQEAVSAHFAGRSPDHLAVDFERVAHVPLLTSASAVIAAEMEAWHDCGDHTLFIGRIIHMRDNDRAPLIYHGGRYGAFVPSAERAIDPAIEFW
jgi:flavin reductase (DIM6/NTAB) family NADH-FMN oxidoreductase RutF